MFCRNCGNELAADTTICMNCGVPVGKGKKYCPTCGAEPDPEAVICVKCGTSLEQPKAAPAATVPADPNAKSKLVAGLLAILCGAFGVHNFYLGFTGKAIAQLLITLLSCFSLSMVSAVWALVEGILILTDKNTTDGKGNPLTE